MAKKTLVKVRILKPVGIYSPGQVVELEQELAEQICAPRTHHNGAEPVTTLFAITQEAFEAALKKPVDKNGLSQGDMTAMGLKNVVQSPKDPIADAALEKKAKEAAEAQKRQDEELKAQAAKDDAMRVAPGAKEPESK